MENIKSKFLLITQDRILRIAFAGLMVIVLTFIMRTGPSPQEGADNNAPDTFIPKGYVLIPVSLQNAESISGMIDDFAIVDLYEVSTSTKQRGLKIGRQLRLLRAPLNPNTFAVLVPENDASQIINASQSLAAVIQGRTDAEANLGQVEKPKTRPSRVQYYREIK